MQRIYRVVSDDGVGMSDPVLEMREAMDDLEDAELIEENCRIQYADVEWKELEGKDGE